MRVEHESGFWATVKDVWTFGDQMAVRKASRAGDALDPEAGEIAIILRAVEEWSAGPVDAATLEAMPAEIGNWVYEQVLEVIAAGPKAPSMTLSSTEQQETAA